MRLSCAVSFAKNEFFLLVNLRRFFHKMDKVSLVLVTVLLVIVLAAQNVELVSEMLSYDDDVNDSEVASSWLDKTYYHQDYQDYEYYDDEKVSSLSLPLKLLPLIVINIVLFLVLFLAAFTTTAASGKRKRSVMPDNDCETDICNDGSLFVIFPLPKNLSY